MHSSESGFTYPEILVYLTIIIVVFFLTIPFFRAYSNRLELTAVAADVKKQIRLMQNNAVSGLYPPGISKSSIQEPYWVFHIHESKVAIPDFDSHYEYGACTSFIFSTCSNSTYGYNEVVLPDRFHIFPVAVAPEPANKYTGKDDINIYFSFSTGNVKVLDKDGNLIDNSIHLNITSDDYPDTNVLFFINTKGNISEIRE